MAVRDVVQYPDERLCRVAEPVGTLTDRALAVCDDLVHTLRHGARGAVGLAAPQIGVGLRIFVMEERLGDGRAKIYVCIDPEITGRSGRTAYSEGCLSFPDGTFVRTERAERVMLAWTDRTGTRQQKKLAGLLAVCAQHELDHLDGTLMVEYGPLEKKESR